MAGTIGVLNHLIINIGDRVRAGLNVVSSQQEKIEKTKAKNDIREELAKFFASDVEQKLSTDEPLNKEQSDQLYAARKADQMEAFEDGQEAMDVMEGALAFLSPADQARLEAMTS